MIAGLPGLMIYRCAQPYGICKNCRKKFTGIIPEIQNKFGEHLPECGSQSQSPAKIG
jgi:hypothetical protein